MYTHVMYSHVPHHVCRSSPISCLHSLLFFSVQATAYNNKTRSSSTLSLWSMAWCFLNLLSPCATVYYRRECCLSTGVVGARCLLVNARIHFRDVAVGCALETDWWTTDVCDADWLTDILPRGPGYCCCRCCRCREAPVHLWTGAPGPPDNVAWQSRPQIWLTNHNGLGCQFCFRPLLQRPPEHSWNSEQSATVLLLVSSDWFTHCYSNIQALIVYISNRC